MVGLEHFRAVRLIDQEPIGRTPRSNPITYMKAYQTIRQLFAAVPEAAGLGLTAAHFSFNVGMGRCARCQGQGSEKLEMYFFEDLFVMCDACEGRRFKPEVLGVRLRGHSIDEVLNMTVQNAQAVFGELSSPLNDALGLLDSLGLGYLRLGQSATSLSGGESQRLKIAAELAALQGHQSFRRKTGEVLYILDEPTTGLHVEDIKKLLLVLGQLVDAGNTVVVVEHHLDVMKCADWIIDLGPGGGALGGHIVAEGRPEEVAMVSDSHTGRYLRPLFEGSECLPFGRTEVTGTKRAFREKRKEKKGQFMFGSKGISA
jgi:excinuclease ABC subunit A